MKTVGVREFQRNMYRYLKELPVKVVRLRDRDKSKAGDVVFTALPPKKSTLDNILGDDEQTDNT